ncbi:MAG TPA: MFS transporter [Candidatus Paceibacterota bacterium]|nr:MFS transporter [Candidatus Paceibacterota bacterium]
MPHTTFARFRAMSPSIHALLYLYWIYGFTYALTNVFIQIFLYQKFTSIQLNVYATMALFTGLMLGFCIPGYIAGRWKLNIKKGFLWSFIANGIAILALLYITDTLSALFVMLVIGFGQGIFYLTVNTFELSETKDRERDFYSSVLNSGGQILSLVGPACATALIWLSGNILNIGNFTLLFAAAPAVYLLGFLCFSNLHDYYPKPVTWADIAHFFTDRRNQYAQLYTAANGFQEILGIIVPPLVILFILGTALRVGIYSTLFAIFSAVCVLAVANYRTYKNRFKIYGVTTLGLTVALTTLGYLFSFVGLIFYTLLEGVFTPLNNVSSHVVSLASMEIGRKESDFYATMILRDFSLWVWRMVGGVVFLATIDLLHTQKEFLSSGLYLEAAGFVGTYLGAYFLVKKMQEHLS